MSRVSEDDYWGPSYKSGLGDILEEIGLHGTQLKIWVVRKVSEEAYSLPRKRSGLCEFGYFREGTQLQFWVTRKCCSRNPDKGLG